MVRPGRKSMLFYSNIFSLMNWKQDGVNPASGMYILNIPLAGISANQLQGPDLDLALRFNQFNANDYGFGTGWELSLARIDEDPNPDDVSSPLRTLVLSDGSRYRMNTEASGAVSLKYKKTNTFTFKQETDGSYTITHIDGHIETISSGRTTCITTPNKKHLYINWNSDNTFTVSDDNATVLLSSSMTQTGNSREHVVTSQRGKFAFTLLGPQPYRLRAISMPGTGNPVLYAFSYISHNTNYFLIKNWKSLINYFQEQTIEYTTLPTPSGLQAAISAVSAVFITQTAFSVEPKKTVDIRYEYPDRNYLGYPDVTTWVDSTDNLENLPGSYSYMVIETVGNEDNPAKTVTYTYNKFYLLSNELPQEKSSNRICFTIFSYQLKYYTGIDDQSPSFMLPVRTDIKSVTETGSNKVYTSFYTTLKYDDYSNLINFRNVDGMSEWYVYYPAAGETAEDGTVLCPPDPNGFIRFLKSTTRSSKTAPDELPQKIWQYTYAKSTDTDLILNTNEQFFFKDKDSPSSISPLKKTSYTYDDPGRMTKAVSAIGSIATQEEAATPSYLETTVTFSYTDNPADNTVTIKKETIGYDNSAIKKTESITQRYITADVISSTDSNNNITDFEYDQLGRVIKSTYAKGHPNTMTTNVVFDVLANSTTTSKSSLPYAEIETFDGSGNLISTSWLAPSSLSPSPEAPGIRYEIIRNEFNDLNQLSTETRFDYPNPEKAVKPAAPLITLITYYKWNIYNELLSKYDTTQSKNVYEYDTFQGKEDQKTVTTISTPGDKKTIAYWNYTHQVSKEETYPSSKASTPDVTETFHYDDFMRLCLHTQTDREEKYFLYDAFDRKISETDTSSGTTLYAYAPHSSDTLISRISVGSAVIGESTYDGLDRVTTSTTLSAKSDYDYSKTTIFTYPNRISISGGRAWDYEYNSVLGQVTKQKILNESRAEIAIYSFSYAEKTGLLVEDKIVRSEGTFTRTLAYNQFNQLVKETGSWGTATLGRYSTEIIPTLCGKPEQVQVSFNKNASIIRAVYKYDSNGNEKFVIFYLTHETLNNSIVWLSQIHRSATTGNITGIDNYAKHLARSSAYNGIRKNFFYGSYNLVVGNSYVFYQRNILQVIMQYNKHMQLSDVSYTFSATNTHKWSEAYQYDSRGSLWKWRRTGNVVYRDEYGQIQHSQRFEYDILNNIYRTRGESGSEETESMYTYNSAFQLEKILTTQSGSQTRTQVDLAYDAEGNIISNTCTRLNATTQKKYTYGAANNITQLTTTEQEKTQTHSYFYNAAGKKIWTAIQDADALRNIATIHAGHCLQIEQEALALPASQQSFRIYHQVNGEIACITEAHANGIVEVRPCFNGPNRTPIVEGHIKAIIHDQVYNYRVDTEYSCYDFRIRGQNPYGMTFDLGSSFYHPNVLFPRLPDFS